MPGRLMTAAEAIAEFGIPSVSTLRTMRARGLPSVKLGKAHLFHSEDIAAFIQAAKVTSPPKAQQAQEPPPAAPAPNAATAAHATAERLKASGRKAAQRKPELVEEGPRTRPFSAAELAKRWFVTTSVIYNLIASGRLQAFKLGGKMYRIKADVVDAYERQEAGQTDQQG